MQEKKDKKGKVYDYKRDTMAMLSSMMDGTFGARMFEGIVEDTEKGTEKRIMPHKWSSVEEIKNIRAGFMTTNEGEKLLRITYHTVFVSDNSGTPEKLAQDSNTLINKCVTQLKKEYKKLTGDNLTLKVAKVKGTKKDGLHVDIELVNNPRIETSHVNSVVHARNPRLYGKFSKFYFFGKNLDDGDVSEKYSD